ncbi:unnamed protein product [Dibothriocephalus latus]|uniref:Uncharacterized protein n=1 Tax=Dibothriocephalus latus TaxID=60516 RepID=A0A3P7MTA5_DIBLA|nr:unnamed protein product [Dibothriocephalus latus]
MFATFLAMTPSQLTYRERVYVALAWMPKATVQAAIGGLALEAARKTGYKVAVSPTGDKEA